MGEVIRVDFSKKVELSREEVTEEPTKDDEEKFKIFSQLIQAGLTHVIVNGFNEDAEMPSFLRNSPYVPIAWSFRFNLKDFSFDPLGVRGTLSFKGSDYWVDLPWSSVWMIYDPNRGPSSSRVWKNSAPQEFVSIIAGEV